MPPEYWAVRDLLAEVDEEPAGNPVLRERIYPRWVYRLKDAADRVRYPSRNPAAG